MMKWWSLADLLEAQLLIIQIRFFHIILNKINEQIYGKKIKIIKSNHPSKELMQVQSLLMENYIFLEGVMENIFLMISGVLIFSKRIGNRLLAKKCRE